MQCTCLIQIQTCSYGYSWSTLPSCITLISREASRTRRAYVSLRERRGEREGREREDMRGGREREGKEGERKIR